MDIADPHFAHPHLLALVPVALVAFAVLRVASSRARTRALRRFASPRMLARLVDATAERRRQTGETLLAAAVILLLVALAGPHWGRRPGEALRTPEEVMLVVDISRSMEAADAPPNRLASAQLALALFLENHRSGRVGLVAFSNAALTLCPPTDDRLSLSEALRNLDTRLSPAPGTDVGAALREAAAATGKISGRRTLILVSDGEDLGGRGEPVAAELARTGVVIHTVTVGTREGAIVNTRSGPVISRADDTTLAAIAKVTGGIAVPAGAGPDALDAIGNALATVAAPAGELRGVDRSSLFIALALTLVAVERVVSGRRKAGAAAPALALSLALLVPDAARADTVSSSPEFHYNEGVRLLRAGSPAGAEAHFREALADAPAPLRPRALHNLGVARLRIALATVDKVRGAPDVAVCRALSARITALRGTLATASGECDTGRRDNATPAILGLLGNADDVANRARTAVAARADAAKRLTRALADLEGACELAPADAVAARHAETVRSALTALRRSHEELESARARLAADIDAFLVWARMPGAVTTDGKTDGEEEDRPPEPMSEAEAKALLEAIRDQLKNKLPEKGAGGATGPGEQGNNR